MAERETQYQRMSRRAFMRRAGGVAITLPSMAAILAACSRSEPSGPGPGGGTQGPYPLARQDAPVTLPLNGEPIAADTALEAGPLQIYNWSDYMWKRVLANWEAETGKKQEWTTFNNMAEAVSKLSAGQVTPDVFFPTPDQLGKLTTAGLLAPLNHDLLPSIAGMWPQFSGQETPFYDQGWRYTVPYTIYTTGIAYRRDKISDEEVAEKGYEIFWDPQYTGLVGVYDDYREALGMAMMRRGETDVNTDDPAVITRAKEDLVDLIDKVNVRATINGAYAKLPAGEFWLHQSWSGDIIGAQYYLPKGESTDILGFYLPDNFAVGNDTIAIPSVSENPALAHHFINYFITGDPADKSPAWLNFSWNGYQPPLTNMDPDTLVADQYVPKTTSGGIVRAEDFDAGNFYLELAPEVDELYQDAWDEFKAGA